MCSHDHACTGHGSLATCSQVINTAGLRNDYTFHSGLQAQEIRLGSPDRFPRERCGLGTTIFLAAKRMRLLTSLYGNYMYHITYTHTYTVRKSIQALTDFFRMYLVPQICLPPGECAEVCLCFSEHYSVLLRPHPPIPG